MLSANTHPPSDFYHVLVPLWLLNKLRLIFYFLNGYFVKEHLVKGSRLLTASLRVFSCHLSSIQYRSIWKNICNYDLGLFWEQKPPLLKHSSFTMLQMWPLQSHQPRGADPCQLAAAPLGSSIPPARAHCSPQQAQHPQLPKKNQNAQTKTTKKPTQEPAV